MSESVNEKDPMVINLELTNGKEIIAKVVEDDSSGYLMTLHKPLIVVYRVGRDGMIALEFAEYMPMASGSVVTINSNQIVAQAIPSEESIDNYLKAIGERVILAPPEKSIILN